MTKCKLEDEVIIEHKIQRYVQVSCDKEREQMTHLAMTIDEKEKFDDEMSEVSSISSSESHHDDEQEQHSQCNSRVSRNQLLTYSQRVTSSLATSSLTSKLSSRSSSSLSATLSLCEKIFTDSS